jgi:F-type H+-transporting ATPase subunit epsilon
MPDTMKLQIVTPDKRLVDGDAEQVQMPGRTGYLGILPGHAPLLTELGPGELSYTHEGKTSYLAVAWGFAEVLPDKVTILADAAERPEEIDVKRAQEAKARAEEALRSQGPALDYEQTQRALRRAEVRLEVAAHVQR